MTRFAALALTTVFSLGALTLAANAATLRTDTRIKGERVTLGDLFVGVGDQAGTAVAQAPALGKSATFDAATLTRIAKTNKVDWQPAGPADQATVARQSTSVDAEAVRAVLTDALMPRLAAGRLQLELDSRGLEFHLPADHSAAVTVDKLTYTPGQGRFSAELTIGAQGPQPQRATVTGRASTLVEVPVLNRRIASGEVIGAGDIAWIEMRADQAGGDLVAAEAQLVGQTPRRVIAPNTVVRVRDIQAQRLIVKGALVTMILQTPALTVTAQGRALQDGGSGESIRVVNTQSNRIVEATVSGSNLVTVMKRDQYAAARTIRAVN